MCLYGINSLNLISNHAEYGIDLPTGGEATTEPPSHVDIADGFKLKRDTEQPNQSAGIEIADGFKI